MSSPVLRTKSIGSKFSDEEYAKLESLAQSKGVTVAEWCRDAILKQANSEPEKTIEGVILEEILALRMLLLNTIFSLANGERLGADEMRELLRRADAEKIGSALERLKK